MSIKVFGSCCSELKEAMTATPSSLFQVEDNGVLYLTVGYVQTKKGISWFQHAALFCPFCGVKLQDRDEIGRRAGAGLS